MLHPIYRLVTGSIADLDLKFCLGILSVKFHSLNVGKKKKISFSYKDFILIFLPTRWLITMSEFDFILFLSFPVVNLTSKLKSFYKKKIA